MLDYDAILCTTMAVRMTKCENYDTNGKSQCDDNNNNNKTVRVIMKRGNRYANKPNYNLEQITTIISLGAGGNETA